MSEKAVVKERDLREFESSGSGSVMQNNRGNDFLTAVLYVGSVVSRDKQRWVGLEKKVP